LTTTRSWSGRNFMVLLLQYLALGADMGSGLLALKANECQNLRGWG
jgi:hypothetical protein